MERAFINILRDSVEETERLLATDGLKTTEYFNISLFCFCYAIMRMQLLQFSKTASKFHFDSQKLHVDFMSEIEFQLKSIDIKEAELDKILDFNDHDRYIGVWSSSYITFIEEMICNRGMLRSEVEATLSILENEYKNVIFAFRNASKGQGKYVLPYKTYISFFLFPITFLEEGNGVVREMCDDYFQDVVGFLPIYCKLANHMQQFIAVENLKLLRQYGIA